MRSLVKFCGAAAAALVLALAPAPAREARARAVTPGQVVISEFRFRGPAGSCDEFVELYNNSVERVGMADVYRTVTGFQVTPVVGVVPPDLPLRPQPGEVAAMFEAPLDYLFDPRHQIVRAVRWQGRERCYYEIEWEGRRIWGATAAMIVNLSRRLELAA